MRIDTPTTTILTMRGDTMQASTSTTSGAALTHVCTDRFITAAADTIIGVAADISSTIVLQCCIAPEGRGLLSVGPFPPDSIGGDAIGTTMMTIDGNAGESAGPFTPAFLGADATGMTMIEESAGENGDAIGTMMITTIETNAGGGFTVAACR